MLTLHCSETMRNTLFAAIIFAAMMVVANCVPVRQPNVDLLPHHGTTTKQIQTTIR